MRKLLALTFILTIASHIAQAKVRPSAMTGDNMVLQQLADARIWGTADPGEKVTVTASWDGKTHTTYTDRCGDWCLAVSTPAASFTPHTITITGDSDTLTVGNVLVGEVWLASGQSNMEMPLKGFSGCCVKDGFKEIASSREQAGRIRFFNVPKSQSYTELDTINASWTIPSPETATAFSAVAWYYARQLSQVLDVPVGIVSAAYGGAKVESWMPRDLLRNYPDISLDPDKIEQLTRYLRPMLMYNAMFNPVSNYTYKGILWYQGCSNVDTSDTYADRLAAMVRHWRSKIGLGDIPFYAVEIAPYDYNSPHDTANPGRPDNAPLLREAQWKAVKMIPNADMICTNDLAAPYERYNIHPGDKESVGRRLCDLALNRTYGKKQFYAGSPYYAGHHVEGDKIVVTIKSPNAGICRNYDIRGFEIAGADHVFYPVENATLRWKTNEIELSHPDVPAPVDVRYCFRDFMPGTLHGGNYLPLIPFRTDTLR